MNKNHTYSLIDFMPLITLFSLIIFITLTHQWYYGWQLMNAMRIMMASFFLIFGGFKLINLSGFAQAYNMYDLIAQKWYWYGYLYPFLEIGLGMLYLLNLYPLATNISTLVLMLISAAGVFNELQKGRQITCACLGTVFKIPMTYVTLAEDLIMAIMAFFMLLFT